MPILFLIVFINLVGFGIVIPLMPFYALQFGAGPEVISWTIAVYSLAQFVTAPFWGKMSDRYGRKPVLIITLIGTVISYIMLGYADNIAFLLLARAFGGLNAGNLGTAFAYVADITTEKDRAKGLGMLGAAFGLGFIFGPALGGFLAGGDMATANYLLPALVSAAFTTVALLGVIFVLPESLKPEIREELANRPKIPLGQRINLAFSRQMLTMLIVTSFLFVTAWALLEAIFGLWAFELFSYQPNDIAYLLVYMGVISVIVQGGLIGPLTKKFGERNLVFVALVLSFIGFPGLAAADNLYQILASLTALSIGSGLFNPSVSSLISKEASASEQGVVLGIFQGAGSLARVVGPGFAGIIYAQAGAVVPFLLAASLMFPSLLIMIRIARYRKLAPSG